MIKVLYAGSPEASSKTLEGLIALSQNEPFFKIVGVLTNPPSAQKRSSQLIPTPCAQIAQKYQIPVFCPEHLDSTCREQILPLEADILVCFAYGHIFGPKFLSLFKFGGINLHPSALPKYRGCTPVNAAILNRDSQTAFTIQKVGLKMDEGAILAQEKITLNFTETAFSLLNDAALHGIKLISNILKETEQNQKIPDGTEQSGIASYTKIILKEDAKIDWNDSSLKIDAFVRAYFKEPCAWCTENEQKLNILSGLPLSENEIDENLLPQDYKNAQNGTVLAFIKSKGIIVKCQNGFYAITSLQRQGKNPMDYKSFMNGARNFLGTVLN